MSNHGASVTPIKAAGKGQGSDSGRESPPSCGEPAEPVIRIGFSEPPDDEPGSLRVWQALIAVCRAAEAVAGDAQDADDFLGLATAVTILTEILEARLIIAPLTRAEEP